MSQSAIPTIRCFAPSPITLTARFDAPQLTSDGGVVWVGQADAELGLCATLADVIPDWRTGTVRYPLELLLRQRIFQIACGYEDQNDAETLRHEPLFQLLCGMLPDDCPLAGQATFSRLENAIDFKTCYRLAVAFLALYLRERGRHGRPVRILIDADSTADPTYGEQEGSAYHGYYQTHMYHPLLLFDGDTGQLICAVLRPGTCHASRGIVPILRRVIRAIQTTWPGIAIAFRGDSGFAIPALYTFLEQQKSAYTIAIGANERLKASGADLLDTAKGQYGETEIKARLFGECRYAAASWEHERRVIYKAEWLPKGGNLRFVVTNRDDGAQALYDWYVQRGGGPELWIKDLKEACFADRLSDHRFWANQFRLFLHAAVYWLLGTIRGWLTALRVPRMQLDTLRLWLIKIGGWLRRHAHGFRLHLASSHPGEPLWHLLASGHTVNA